MKYGDVSPSHRERFEPGSIQHCRRPSISTSTTIRSAPSPGIRAAGLKLDNGRQTLAMWAELPPIPAADRALAEIRAGRVNGLIRRIPRPERERRDGALRVIESAELRGIGIVRSPSYGDSRVEARAKSGRILRATIPADRDLQCECVGRGGGGAECAAMVRLQREVMEPMAAAVARAFEEAQAGLHGRDVLAVARDYGNPVASARRGTLRAVAGDDGLEIEVDLPTGRVGDDVQAASETAGLVARPLISYEDPETEFVDGPDGRVVSRARVRAFLIGATDARDGWPDARIDHAGEGRAAATPPRERRRRIWL